MLRIIMVLLTIFAGLTATQGQAGSLHDGKDAVLHNATCAHYQNRARFSSRNQNASLEVHLADSCARAFRSLYARFDTSPYEQKHALTYLNRLSQFKDEIITINMDRMFGTDRTRRTVIQGQLGDHLGENSMKQPVTASGEYLIARSMGVIGAYRAWADVTDFELAQER